MPGRVVRTRIYAVTFTIPAATPIGVPVVTPFTPGLARWDDVRVIIPAGHQFLTGIRLSYANANIVPFNDTPTFLTGNDDELVYPVDLDVTAPIVLTGYNDDVYPHTFHCRFRITDWPDSPAAPVTAIPLSVLNGAG